MRMKTKLSLGGGLVGVLLVAGLSYWAIGEGTQPVVPKGSAGALSPPKVSAPTAPPVSTAVSPSAPPISTAVLPSAPPATAEPAEASMSEADRRQVQEALHRLDYYHGPVDGIFGPLTRAAIRRFQHDIGAEITGYLTAEEASRLVRTH